MNGKLRGHFTTWTVWISAVHVMMIMVMMVVVMMMMIDEFFLSSSPFPVSGSFLFTSTIAIFPMKSLIKSSFKPPD